MRLVPVVVIAAMGWAPGAMALCRPQDETPYRAEVFADRSILVPQSSSYPLVALAHDSKGQIYVLGFDFIVKLSQEGKVLKRLPLRRGQGPGEVQNLPSVMAIGLDDRLYINDGAKIVVYTPDLTFVRNISIRTSGGEIYVDKDGRLYCRKNDFSTSQPEEFLAKYDAQGQLAGAYLRTPDLTKSTVGGMIIGTPHPYVPRTIFCLDLHGAMFSMPNTSAQVSCLDDQGHAVPAFEVDLKKSPISGAEKAEVERVYVESMKSNLTERPALHYADYRPYYRKILIDEHDRFYFVRTGSVLDKGNGATVDVYQNGRKMQEITLEGDPMIAFGDHLYYLVNNDDGTGELKGAIMRIRVPHEVPLP